MSDPSYAASEPPATDAAPQAPATSSVPVALEVDATGLSCPMPVLELAKAMTQVEIGEHVRLSATDPAARVDVPVWCRMQRQGLRSTGEEAGTLSFVIRRAR